MTISLRILLASIAAALAVAFVVPLDGNGADYPTPRSTGVRRTTPTEVLPAPASAAAVDPTSAVSPPSAPVREAEPTRRPKIVRVAVPTTDLDAEPRIVINRAASEAPRELSAPSRNMPTPRAINRPRPYTGPRVEPLQPETQPPAQPARATSHESDEPAVPAAPAWRKPIRVAVSPSNQAPVAAPNVNTNHSLPRVKVDSELAANRIGATFPVAMKMQPSSKPSAFKPTQADLDRWFTPLDQVGILPQPEPGDLPPDLSGNLFSVDDRPRRKDWPEREFNWEAPEIWHQPLYFEDVPLERYGQSIAPNRQAWLSGLKFYMTFPLLPVKLWADPPFSKVATFGYYRVGSDNPAVRQKSIMPYGFGPWGHGLMRGAGSFWEVPPTPAWETTPGAAP